MSSSSEKINAIAEEVDTMIWSAFRKGDQKAFEVIFRTYAKELLNYGYKVTPDKKLIEDSIQDLFYELWQSRERLNATTSIRFYLFRALRYKITRNTKCYRNEATSIDVLDSKIADDSYEAFWIKAEEQTIRNASLKNLIDRLPGRQQEAINLRYYHNFSNEEIAEIMGVNYQSACKFLYTALKSLKEKMMSSLAHR